MSFQLAAFSLTAALLSVWVSGEHPFLLKKANGSKSGTLLALLGEIPQTPSRSLNALGEWFVESQKRLRTKFLSPQKEAANLKPKESSEAATASKKLVTTFPELLLDGLQMEPKRRLLKSVTSVLSNELSRGDNAMSDPNLWPSFISSLILKVISSSLEKWLTQEHQIEWSQLTLSKNIDYSLFVDSITKCDNWCLYEDILYINFYKQSRDSCRVTRANKSKARGLAASVEEDLIVTIAEIVCRIYLDLLVAGESLLLWPPLTRQEISSTRAVIGFKNKVAIWQWMEFNFGSVLLMYNDRFCLRGIKDKAVTGAPLTGKSVPRSLDGEEITAQGNQLLTQKIFIQSRRGSDLQKLQNWRLLFSLLLEVFDILEPVVRVVASKLGEAISFLLVALIGRSLGLVYKGIRQSFSKVTGGQSQ